MAFQAVVALALAWVVVTSLVAFVLAGYDKRRAVRREARVPERRLLGMALVGGTFGLLAGMVVFHHKTRKASFLARFVGIVVLQGALLWFVAPALGVAIP